MDTCTRLARFTLQEYFEDVKGPVARALSENRFIATAVVVVLSILLLQSGGFSTLWPLFGSANQLLAALALLAIAVWLIKKNVNATFVTIPMFFMFIVTLSSLGLFAWQNFQNKTYVLSVVSSVLFVLSIILIIFARRSLKKHITSSSPKEEPKGKKVLQ